MLTRCLRPFVLAWICAALPVAAHHVGEDPATVTDVATAAIVTLTGSVDALVVVDLVNAKTQRYPILRQSDGTKVALRGEAVQGVKAGAQVAVTGSQTGAMFTVSGVQLQSAQPTTASAVPAVPAHVTGKFMVAHADDFETGTSRFFYQVFDDAGGIAEIEMPFLPGLLATGMRVLVDGSVAADGVSIDPATITIQSPPPVLSAFPATTNYIVLPIKFPNADGSWPADPFTPASLNTAVFGSLPTKSAKEFYKEASFSQQQIAGITADDGAGGFLKSAVPKPATCDINVIATAAQNAAHARGYPIDVNGNPTGGYTGLLYVFNNVAGCGWAGLAYVGWPRAYSNNTSALWVIGHELGHNFGLLHAGSLRCTGAVIGCVGASVAEYGDPFSTMGNSGNTGHFNASQKDILGWITPSMTKTHTGGTATYTLYPIETGGFATYAVRIPTANTSRTYSIEYRQPVGVFDAFVKPPSYPNAGAQIRIEYPFEASSGSDDTELLDMTPATGSFGDAALLAGQTFTDSVYGVSISVLTATASSMTVQVSSPAGTLPSTVTQTTSLTPAAYATPVTFTATVAVTGAAPTGQVNFTEAGGAIAGCAPASLTGSAPFTATCTTSLLAPGTHSIIAIYGGDGAYKVTAATTALSQVVNKAASSVTLASSLNPSPAGGSVTLTATVTGAASPTGAVNFKDGATSITGCSAVALTGSGLTRTAACTTSTLANGSRNITAVFAGDAINATSTSPVLVQAVGLSSSTTTLGSSGNPSMLGSSVTFTATVTGNAPTGPVNFTDGGTSLAGCGTVALSGGGNSPIALCTAPSLAAGVHNIVATYAGNSNNVGSASTMVAQAVTVSSATTITTSITPQNQGKLVTFTATVTGAAPTGSVDFQDGGTSIPNCNMSPVTGSGNSRTATCLTTTLAFGTHSITAVYSGDVGNASSSSTAITQDISATAVGTPTLQIIYSRKTHATSGDFDLPLAP
jgi:Bacterial Ig-like domain (group 3)